ncbi:MAG: hypothetical protein JWP88_2109 [Flaviaesturariibacter sp.]|nr:hypothetical protein [Flaviaesturariibacter sp.]
MKTLFVLLCLSCSILHAQKGDSWKIIHNGKTILTGSPAKEEAALVGTISRASITKKGALQVVYASSALQKGWQRTISVYNDAEQELVTTKGGKLTLTNEKLERLMASSGTISIYTVSLPTDPAKQAVVRVRRVLLGKITLRR